MRGYILSITFWGKYTFLWLKNENGVQQLKLRYHPVIYSKVRKDIQIDFQVIRRHKACHSVSRDLAVCGSDNAYPEDVIRIEIESPPQLKSMVKFLHKQRFTLFNSDIHPKEKFFADTSSFPLALCDIQVENDLEFSITMLEDVYDPLYKILPLSVMEIDIDIDTGSHVFPQWSDPLRSVDIIYRPSNKMPEPKEFLDPDRHRGFKHRIEGDEQSILLSLRDAIEICDPDVLLIEGGDSFKLNYIAHRVKEHGLIKNYFLGRLKKRMRPISTIRSQSYMSYGMILHRNTPSYIPGRIYLDPLNSFFYMDSGLSGLTELARLGGVPPDRCARNSIGTVLTAMEIKIACDSIPRILVPEIKAKGEKVKSSKELLAADNGGVIFPALPGLYEGVWGIDFASLYPSIMMNHNISSETVLCNCCINSPDHIVPEVNYHVCSKRYGIVSQAMKLILSKRLNYKYMKRSCDTPEVYEHLDQIDSALKWVLVSAFGYLGFRNAKWGSIESHQCVTAYARHYLRMAEKIAYEEGYETIAGITDSLFVRSIPGTEDSPAKIESLVYKISKATGVPMNIDGYFNWIVFANVRDSPHISALNRYYGCYKTGIVKIRGIESRKHSTCNLIKEFQSELLGLLSLQKNKQEFLSALPHCEKKLLEWQQKVKCGVKRSDLVIKIRSGRGSKGYNSNLIQADVAREYEQKGKPIEAGQSMRYIVRDFHGENRIIIEPELTEDSPYDVEWYLCLLEKGYLDLLGTVMLQEYGEIKLPKLENVLVLNSYFS